MEHFGLERKSKNFRESSSLKTDNLEIEVFSYILSKLGNNSKLKL